MRTILKEARKEWPVRWEGNQEAWCLEASEVRFHKGSDQTYHRLWKPSKVTLEVNHWLGDTESFSSLDWSHASGRGESPTRESSREAGNRGGGQ